MCTRLFQRRRKGIHLRASSNLPHNIEESVSKSLTQNMQRVFKCAERTSKHNAAMIICHFHFRRTGPEPKKRMTTKCTSNRISFVWYRLTDFNELYIIVGERMPVNRWTWARIASRFFVQVDKEATKNLQQKARLQITEGGHARHEERCLLTCELHSHWPSKEEQW